MKIMHVELGRHLYGGARQVFYLLKGLYRYPIQNTLISAEHSELSNAFEDDRVKVIALPMRGDHDVFFLARLVQTIRAEKPDLIHIHSRRGETLAALAGLLTRTPMVYSRRVDNKPSRFDIKFRWFKHIITISQGIRSVLLEFGLPEDFVSCVHSSVDTERFKPESDRTAFLNEFNLKPDQIVLGVIAQLIQRKGHKVLLDAMPAILARHPDVQVLILGQGPLEADLNEWIAQKKLSHAVRIIGFRRDLHALIPHFNLIVHPALMEGLGVSLLEAASAGVPIVASRVGGIPEIVRDGLNGSLVDAGDSIGLAQAINRLLDDPTQLKKLGEAGRQLVLNQFSIQQMVDGNYKVYRAITPLSTKNTKVTK